MGSMSHVFLSGAHLEGTQLATIDLRAADFSHAYLNGADLANSDLSDANFIRARLGETTLSRTNLTGADDNVSAGGVNRG